MKQIFLLILIAFSFTAHAQVMKYRVFQCKVYNPEEEKEPSEWSETNILVVFDADKRKLVFYANEKIDLDIIKTEQIGDDKLGNSWYEISCNDQSGVDCIVKWEILKGPQTVHMATMFLEYKNVKCIYRLRENN